MAKKNKTEEEQMRDDLHDLKALYDTNGGKRLVSLLIKDVASQVQRFGGQYATLSHIEMIALGASIHEKLALIHILTRSKENLEVMEKELEDALSE